jgi:hypothetical protein
VTPLTRIAVLGVFVAASAHLATAQESVPAPSAAPAVEATPAPAPSPAAADTAPAPAPEQRVVVHGYLSQAYVKSDGHQVIGIPDSGSADYRRAALLFRALLTPSDALVLQLAQRRLGESPSMAVEPDVKVDWAFYEHRFGSATRVRVGRMPVPVGLFAETRFVGTLLPFYRAPYNFYQEGSFTSENINGAHVSHTFGSGSVVSVETHAFAGAYTTTEEYDGVVSRAKAENVYGGQVWVATPIEGLRFGIGGSKQDIKNTILTGNGRDNWSFWISSVELARPRYRLLAEYSANNLSRAGFSKRNTYVYAGAGITSRLRVNVAYDDGDATYKTRGRVFALPQQFSDAALGLSFAFRPDVVAKAEYHWNEARLVEDMPGALDPLARPFKTNYAILSLSASF